MENNNHQKRDSFKEVVNFSYATDPQAEDDPK